MTKKTWPAILICFIISLFCIGCEMYHLWCCRVIKTMMFKDWLVGSEVSSFVVKSLGSLGINMLSSVLFLVFVDRVIENRIENARKQLALERVREEVLQILRTDPSTAIHILKSSSEYRNLLSNQYIGGCNLSHQNLDGLDLSGANLVNVNLSGASLINTNLCGCIMSSVILTDSRMALTNLKGTNLDESLLEKAYCLRNATLPSGALYDGRFELQGDVVEAAKLNLDIVHNNDDKRTYYSLSTK